MTLYNHCLVFYHLHKDTTLTVYDLLIKHEGLRLKVYKCSEGFNTIGFGRNLDTNGISEEEAFMMLEQDIFKCRKQLDCLSFAKKLNEARYAVLIDMIFNLGFAGFTKFKLMIAALESGDYNEAATQMLDSRWAKQVGVRANELAEIMTRGTFE